MKKNQKCHETDHEEIMERFLDYALDFRIFDLSDHFGLLCITLDRFESLQTASDCSSPLLTVSNRFGSHQTSFEALQPASDRFRLLWIASDRFRLFQTFGIVQMLSPGVLLGSCSCCAVSLFAKCRFSLC